MSWAAVVTRGQDAHQSTCCFHTNSRTTITIISRRMSTKKEKDRHRRGRAPATITTAPYSFFPPAVLKGLCVLSARRQKRKTCQEGTEGVKGGRGESGEVVWTSARDALPPGNSGLLTHRILQAQQTLPQGLAAAFPAPTPTSVATHNRRSRSHGTGKGRAVLLLILRPILTPLYTKSTPVFLVFAMKRTEAQVTLYKVRPWLPKTQQ